MLLLMNGSSVPRVGTLAQEGPSTIQLITIQSTPYNLQHIALDGDELTYTAFIR